MRRGRLAGAAMTGIAIALLGGAGRSAGIELTLAHRPLALTGYAMVRQVIPANQSTPDERTLEQLWLEGRYQWSYALAFDVTLDVQNGGPTTERTKGGIYSYRSVFQSVSPSVQFEEAFVDASLDALDLRAGLLKFAWGKLDRVQPVDVLNVERYSDPFLLEEDERKIGVPALEGSYALPARSWIPEEARLTAVWIPQYMPYRFPLFGERWFPPASVPPPRFVYPPLMLSVPIGFRTVNSSPPSFQLDNCGYAGRASAFAAGVDFALYYYHGFDRQPAFRLTAEASGEPFAPESITAMTELRPVFRTIDLWGADAAYAWDRFTFRLEAAYVAGRPFARDIRFLVNDPRQLMLEQVIEQINAGRSPVSVPLPQSFAVRNAVEWGVGVDYTWNDFLLLLQVNQTDILHNDVDLLIRNVDTVLSANLRRSFLHDDLTVQLIGVQGLESGYTVLLPRITYRFWERLEARAGYLFIAGSDATVVGQYKDNDEGFIWLRYLI